MSSLTSFSSLKVPTSSLPMSCRTQTACGSRHREGSVGRLTVLAFVEVNKQLAQQEHLSFASGNEADFLGEHEKNDRNP